MSSSRVLQRRDAETQWREPFPPVPLWLGEYWMGYENREMRRRYAKQLMENIKWRKEWAENVGQTGKQYQSEPASITGSASLNLALQVQNQLLAEEKVLSGQSAMRPQAEPNEPRGSQQ